MRRRVVTAQVAPASVAASAFITGGGIGGLAAAAFLRQRGLNAHVYEQAPAFKPAGGGIVLATPPAAVCARRLVLVSRRG